MKRQLLTGALLLFAFAGRSQTAARQVIGTSGGSFSGSGFSADHTTGYLVSTTGVSGSFMLTQGFQQPSPNPVSVSEVHTDVSYKLYPNPAQTSITLELNSSAAAELRLSVSSINGRQVYGPDQLSVQNSFKKEINVSAWATGMYFANLYDQQGTLVQSIRFQKQ